MRSGHPCTVVFAASVLLVSCAANMPKISCLGSGDASGLHEISYSSQDRPALVAGMNELRQRVKGYRKPLSAREYDALITELNAIIRKYEDCRAAENIVSGDKSALVIPPRTRFTIDLDTYCLAPDKASPQEDEPYILVNDVPAIPLYAEIMRYSVAKERVDRMLKQNLFWNLKNKVQFEDLPLPQKELLLKVDPASYLKVNNSVKEFAKSSILGLVNEYVPGDAMDAFNIVRGKAYEYRDYESRIENARSKFEKPPPLG